MIIVCCVFFWRRALSEGDFEPLNKREAWKINIHAVEILYAETYKSSHTQTMFLDYE